MHGFSTIDGFIDVNDCVVEMMKSVANEPSMGLFYVQQHTQNAVPNLIHTKNKIVEKSNEVTLHTANLEDSMSTVRSMKYLGVPIADQMTKDIQKSLITLSTSKVQKRTFFVSITQEKSDGTQLWGGLRIPRTGSWSASVFGSSSASAQGNGNGYWGPSDETSTSQPSQVTEFIGSSSYLSTMIISVKQKAAFLRWPQRGISGLDDLNADESCHSSDAVEADRPIFNTTDGLLISSQMNEQLGTCESCREGSNTKDCAVTCIHDTSETIEDCEKLKSVHQAKLEEWLKDANNELHASENEELP